MVILVALAAIAIIALFVAGTAHLRDQRHRARRSEDEELFTTTPLPMPSEELARLARESTPHDAFNGLRIPRWVQAGSLLVALAITYAVAQRVSPNDDRANARAEGQRDRAAGTATDLSGDAPEDLDLAPDSAPPFAFRVGDWVPQSGGGCSGQLIVTQGEPNAWSLTARVHDGQGRLIDTARTRVTALRAGEVVEFRFPRADCDRIGAWDVHGARAAR